jgi:hypothetical protein
MTKPSASPASEMDREAYRRLRAHVGNVQNQVCVLAALIEGMAILKDFDNGSNALGVILDIAMDKASQINAALDSVNLPGPDPLQA